MTVDAPRTPVPRRGTSVQYKDPHERGWVLFSATMLGLIGVSNCIGGIGAISTSKFFTGAGQYLIGDLKGLGWVVLILGVVQVLAAIGVARTDSFAAVWIGVASTGVNLAAQLLFVQAQPLWSLAIIAVDAAVLFGLITYAQPD
jgi:hypothetical protein